MRAQNSFMPWSPSLTEEILSPSLRMIMMFLLWIMREKQLCFGQLTKIYWEYK